MKTALHALALLGALYLAACGEDANVASSTPDYLRDTRPLARYWWFAEEMDTLDIAYNLDWLVEHGFGGVELAFVYPPGRMKRPRDTTRYDKPAWLSNDWQALVEFTYRYADRVGLSVDITGGSLWPFGDPEVPFAAGSRRFSESLGGTDTAWREEITAHWEWPKQGRVVDHLTPAHYLPYFERTLGAYPEPMDGSALFVDSWEVDTRGLWSDDFGEAFAKTYGYRIEPFMDSLYADGRERERYHYHELLSEKVLQFYRDFDSVANANGYASRGQVSGAPVDLLDGYMALDVPEGEALLYEPEFNRIPASAAAIAGKPIVSAETFTCLYGWPRNHMRQEQVADLKLLADALFANGVNQIVWHGKPHTRRAARDSTNFYATVHLGDSSTLTPHLKEFNAYLERVAYHLRRGKPYYHIAQYLPTEDAWVKGEMPIDSQFIWAWGHYEMRYVYPLGGINHRDVLWVNTTALRQAAVDTGGATCFGGSCVEALVVSSQCVSEATRSAIEHLTAEGARVLITEPAHFPGTDSLAIPGLAYGSGLGGRAVVRDRSELSPYTLRVDGDTLLLFVVPAEAERIEFPMRLGQASGATAFVNTVVYWEGAEIPVTAYGKPGQSLLFEIYDGVAVPVDIGYVPPPPDTVATELPEERPWLVQR